MSVQADWALIQSMVTTIPQKPVDESYSGYEIFRFTLGTDIDPSVYEIIDLDANYSLKVDISIEEGEILVNAPTSLVPAITTPKKRKPKKQIVPREYLMRIPVSEAIEKDARLFKDASRLSISLTEQLGPFVCLSPGRISLTFGLYFSTYCNGGIAENSVGQASTVSRVFRRAFEGSSLQWQPQPVKIDEMFAVLTEPKQISDSLFSVPGVLTPLHSFQCQSVRWCLGREGCAIVENGPDVVDTLIEPAHDGWTKMGNIWVNPYNAKIRQQRPEPANSIRGGLLAEEMGLGKTLEIIALINLHRRKESDGLSIIKDQRTGDSIQQIKTTLVIVPAGILEQWVTELENHAPNLSVCTYTGKGAVSPTDLAEADVVLASYSVIASEIYAASFNPGLRNTRFWRDRPDIKKVKSSLVQVQFWRVVLDEVQMIHAGVNNAARVASLIPRVNAWAVTGTPVKNSIEDLRGQFGFLNVQPFAGKHAFNRLITSSHDFADNIRQIGLRHTKFMLRDKLKLPPQNRKLIMLRFNETERLFYENVREQFIAENTSEGTQRQLLVRLRQACCIPSANDHPVFTASNGVTLTIEQALGQLIKDGENKVTRLVRQKVAQNLELGHLYLINDREQEAISLFNDQLGKLNNEVVENEKIRDELQTDKLAMDEKVKTQKQLFNDLSFELDQLGHKLAAAAGGVVDVGEDSLNPLAGDVVSGDTTAEINPSSDNANVGTQTTVEASREDSDATVEEVKLERHVVVKVEPVTLVKQEENSIWQPKKQESEPKIPQGVKKVMRKERKEPKKELKAEDEPSVVLAEKSMEYETVDVSGNPEFIAKRQQLIDAESVYDDLVVQNHTISSSIKNTALQISMCRELLHRAYFFLGTGHFRVGQDENLDEGIKQAHEALEKDFYAKADELRGILLAEEQSNFVNVRDKLKKPEFFQYSEPKNVFEVFFNKQAEKMLALYDNLMTILQANLLELETEDSKDSKGPKDTKDPADPKDAEEHNVYSNTMDLQDKAYVYLSALEGLLRYRESLIFGEKPDKSRKRKRSKIEEHDKERSENAENMRKTLNLELQQLREPVEKYIVAEKRRVAQANEEKFKQLERDLAKRHKTSHDTSEDFSLERSSSIRHEHLEKLKTDCRVWKRELGTLTDVFNTRLEYYKSLQSISDKVRDPELQDTEGAIKRKLSQLDQTDAEIKSAEARLQFILRLKIDEGPDIREEKNRVSDDVCIICQETYEQGSFTTCGHRCCTSCLRSWVARNPICPLCKTKLSPTDIFQFTYGELPDESKLMQGSSQSDPKRMDNLGNDIYSHISATKYNQITQEPIKKSYGVKIDMIVRHILLLKRQIPEVQIVIFTQWAKMLGALMHALSQNGVRAIRKSQPRSVSMFRSDPNITCFILHTANDSAGLTLTNATHVILCEPLLTTAIELQAISRIHRIGQLHKTTVWLFAVQDTVEQQILALSTERRVDLAKENHQTDEVVESEILTSTMGNLVDRSSGSELVMSADLNRILGMTATQS